MSKPGSEPGSPALLKAAEAMAEALVEILEGCASEDRSGDIHDNQFQISRAMRAHAHRALRLMARAKERRQ